MKRKSVPGCWKRFSEAGKPSFRHGKGKRGGFIHFTRNPAACLFELISGIVRIWACNQVLPLWGTVLYTSLA